jgi:signal transduction histidine kinase/CheY-like chemotaxis protein
VVEQRLVGQALDERGVDGDLGGGVTAMDALTAHTNVLTLSRSVGSRMAHAAPIWLLNLALAGAAAALAVFVAGEPPLAGAPVQLAWWALAPLFYLAELLVIHLPFRRDAYTFTLSEIPLVLGLFLATPDDLVVGRVVGAVVALAITTRSRQRPAKLVFNVAFFALEAAAAAAIFHALVPSTADGLSVGTSAAAIAAALGPMPLGVILVQSAIALSEGRPDPRKAVEALAIDLLVAVASTSLALVCVGLLWSDPYLGFLVVPLVVVLFLAFRAYVSARQRHDALEFLYETGRMLHGAAEFESALTALLSQARTAFRAEIAAATLAPSGAGESAFRTLLGPGEALETMRSLEGDRDALGERALEEGRALRFPSTRGGPPLEVAGVAVRDAMVAPLRGDRQVLGTIVVANRLGEFGSFSADELRLFETLAAHAAVTLEATRLDRELTQLTESMAERRRLEKHLRQSQKLEAVGRLAGGIAHEFNNLLTAIGGYSELLLARLQGEERQHVEEISSAANRAARLTRQLLAFGRKQVARPEVLDLNEVIEHLEGMIRPMLGARVELVTDLEPGLINVSADPGLLEEALLNLAINARDAMPEGGMLTIRTENVEVASLSPGEVPMPAGRYALLSVSDTGHGMDEETRARAFEPFFTTKGIGEGTGLGLASVYGIVKQSGGFIFVRSRPSAGARFDVYLPAKDSAPGHAREPVPPVPVVHQPTVLLVEDEPAVRRVIREMLERARFNVVEASDGPEALAVSTRFEGEIDLLVTDSVMPHMSGSELYELLELERRDISVLYMSGYPSGAILDEDLDPTMPFIQKPFSAATLVERAHEILAARATVV